MLSALLPSSIEGLVVYDLVDGFRLDRRTGICAMCHRPFLLESRQPSLARRGMAVYHPTCFRERRRRYMRDYRADGGPVSTTDHHYCCRRRPRNVAAMEPQRSLALDLFRTRSLDQAAVTRLVVDHAVGPARRAWSLPAPRPGEARRCGSSRQPAT